MSVVMLALLTPVRSVAPVALFLAHTFSLWHRIITLVLLDPHNFPELSTNPSPDSVRSMQLVSRPRH